jgi:signal transduction histidine kinase
MRSTRRTSWNTRARELNGDNAPARRGQTQYIPPGRELLDRAALNSLTDQLAVLDHEGNIIRANVAWMESRRGRLIGLDAFAPVGTNFLDICGRAAVRTIAATRATQGIRSVIDRESPRFRLEYSSRATGGRRWTLMTVEPLQRPAGGAIVRCVDTTDQRNIRHKVRTLSRLLLSAQEHERTVIARELHDDVTQQIAATALDLAVLLPRIVPAGDDARVGLQQIIDRLRKLCTHVHRLSRRMHPRTLETLGLASAVEEECRAFADRTGLGVATRIGPFDPAVPQPVALAAFRICQESLHNVEKHARATSVRVELDRTHGRLRLRVKDTGVGFTASPSQEGIGLCGMKERAAAVGGRVSITSAPGRGTAVTFTAPLKEAGA